MLAGKLLTWEGNKQRGNVNGFRTVSSENAVGDDFSFFVQS